MKLLSETLNLIKQNKLHLRRQLGQNFLVDENILEKIIRTVQFSADDEVLEIGTGFGWLTQKIAQKVKNLITFEIDRGISRVAQQILKDCPNVQLIQEDFLKFDFAELPFKKTKIIANLPYNITSPAILKILENSKFVSEAFLMVQKEVAARILAAAGTKNYSSFSIFCQYHAEIEKLFLVSRNSFFPRPKVDSIFLKMTPKKERLFLVDEPLFFNIIRLSFSQRRKMLFKVLGKKPGLKIKEAFEFLKLDPKKRPEELKIEDFAALANFLAK